MKYVKLKYFLFFLHLLVFVPYVFYLLPNDILQNIVTGTTDTVVHLTTRTPIAQTILFLLNSLLLLYFLPINKIIIAGKFILSIGLIFLAGQYVVYSPHMIKESFFFITIKKQEITDRTILFWDYNGYDKEYHHRKSEYPCYEFCENLFTRNYQTGINKEFVVFCGFGPLFRLEQETFNPNAYSKI